MFMVMYVLDDPDLLDAVLDAWEAAGVGGVTILESTGVQRHRASGRRPALHLPFGQIPLHPLRESYTLLSVVDDRALVERCLAATEALVGDLSGPNTGIFASWPLEVVCGVPKAWANEEPG